MARLCAGVMAFVLLFRANRLLVSAKAQLGTRQHYPLLWVSPWHNPSISDMASGRCQRLRTTPSRGAQRV